MKKSMPLSVMAAELSLPPDPSFLSHTGHTWIMGVLNATPDSFYAGSHATTTQIALSMASQMIEDGADILDVGGESTRPGAHGISTQDELERVLPILEVLREHHPDIPLSIDTQKAAVARKALELGVQMVNDISAMRHDPAMPELIAETQCPIVFMHMQGTPQTMQEHPRYANVVDEVTRFFEERLAFAARQNIKQDRIVLDPGIGFGKTLEHNMDLLAGLSKFRMFGRPILVGASRKSFIGRWLAEEKVALPVEERLEGSVAVALWAVQKGARGLRVHDVGPTRRALHMWQGIQGRTAGA